MALLLAGLAMLGPFSVDTYLPAFPTIATSLQATPLEVQQTLTAYMFAFSFMTLWHGALADAFGRRTVVIVALGLFAVASLACAAVHRVEYLWAFRIVQGMSAGAGVVVGRAIIRDLFDHVQAARTLSTVTMIFSAAPAVAPVIGGWVVEFSDWRNIFLGLFLFAVLLAYRSAVQLPETLPPEQRVPFHCRRLARGYRSVFLLPTFQFKAGAVAANFAGLFLYVAAAPVFITVHLGLGPGDFGWQFGPMVAGIFLGAFASNRLAGRVSTEAHVGAGYVCMIGAGLANLAFHLFALPSLPYSVMPLLLYGFGMSVAAPIVTLLIIDLFPSMRGLVTSCQSFTQTMLSALVAGALAPVLADDVRLLAAGQLAFACIGWCLWRAGRSYHRRHAPKDLNAWESVQLE